MILTMEDLVGPKFGPTGKDVYERTYSRTKADGSKENWRETVERVVSGNLALVPERFIERDEREKLNDAIYNFRIIPAGRHLWMSGVEGRQFLFNCYVSGWGDRLSEHFTFTFNQLMEGGGVGSNYSAKYVNDYKYPICNLVNVHIVCSPDHENYNDLERAGILSEKYSHLHLGAFEVEDSREGWVMALEEIIDSATDFKAELEEPIITLVFDVSNVRASGKRIKTFGGTSAGPVPLAKMLTDVADILNHAFTVGMNGEFAMMIDHAIASCVVSGNVRRSARMSIMRWDDPYIDWFLDCKKEDGKFWSTNISVEIDDEFIELVNSRPGHADILFGAKAKKAKAVYHKICEGMLTNGEPGIWNSSLANLGEPNRVIATNPCGEICLEPWENCNLGHVNLDAFVNSDGTVDYDGLIEAHRLMTRFLIRATFGDISNATTREVVDRNRRVGVGHFGYAGYVAKRGIRYSDSWKVDVPGSLGDYYDIGYELTEMYAAVATAAAQYSHELRIPMPVKLTTVAPTGTIAKLPGRSEGIHPIYARYFIRRIRYSVVDPDQRRMLEDYRNRGYNVVIDPDTMYTEIVEIPTKELLVEELEELGINPEILESVDEISLDDLLRVQAMYQTFYADNAVSFTANVPVGRYTPEELGDTLRPFLRALKGSTLMPDASRKLAPYERLDQASFDALRGSEGVSVDASYDEDCASGACPVR